MSYVCASGNFICVDFQSITYLSQNAAAPLISICQRIHYATFSGSSEHKAFLQSCEKNKRKTTAPFTSRGVDDCCCWFK